MLTMLAAAVACVDRLPDQDLRITATPPAFKLSADDLWKDFQRNPKGAAKQYFGKAVDVSGKVIAVQPDATKVPVVYFAPTSEHGLRARLLDERAAETMKAAVVGTRVTLRCFCEGLTAEQDLLLKSCIRP